MRLPSPLVRLKIKFLSSLSVLLDRNVGKSKKISENGKKKKKREPVQPDQFWPNLKI